MNAATEQALAAVIVTDQKRQRAASTRHQVRQLWL
jgi:hypothetical protein